MVKLVRPTIDLKPAYMSFYEEWKASGEATIPWVIGKDPTDFEGMVQSLLEAEKGIGLPEGWVPDSTYWLIDEEYRILGVVNIRHKLTEHLMNAGGHIGYGIRPSERQKGFATGLLKLALEKTRDLGIERALVVCDAINVGSEKTIQKNGGIEDTNFVEDDGNVIKRYWIG
ncbi:GNAT family N-acetyltransferase [Paenisporosarcina sp. NPDC076898]|uniref:GNAT family N-acetyltransferase n=1 Tax=unclassified Paenisporosarcina TaxID=2642018 RepID=UPI003D01E8AB